MFDRNKFRVPGCVGVNVLLMIYFMVNEIWVAYVMGFGCLCVRLFRLFCLYDL